MGKEIEKVKVIGSDGKEYERTPCVTYARPMGYIAPVQNFNRGKLSEFRERVYFEENKVDNSPFLKRWASASLINKQQNA